jgi:hypothetical protein
VEKVIVDPENGEQPIVVVQRQGTGRRRLYKVIVAGGEEDDLFPAGSGARKLRDAATDGETFYFRVNNLPNSTRGRSDLLSAIDWCDAYETFLAGELDRAILARSTVFDVTLRGATEEQVKERAKTIQPPKPGGIRVHNDAEVWEVKTPELGVGDADTGARLIRNHVLGGASIPEQHYGGGGDVNRATAQEMGDPFEKVLTQRQNWWKATLAEIGGYAIACRLRADGRDMTALSEDPAFRVRANFPELVTEDVSKYATALGQVVSATATAIDRGLMADATGVAVIAQVASRLGVTIDPPTELATAREQAATRQADQYGVPPDMAAAGDMAAGGGNG